MGNRDSVQWEYRTLRPPREPTMKEAKDPTDSLNELGADGWELAETIDYVGGGTKLLILKRSTASTTGDGDEERKRTTGSETSADGTSGRRR